QGREKRGLKGVTDEGPVTITPGTKKADGNHAVFAQGSRTVVLTGNAVLEEGSNQVSGDRIVVHPDDSRMEVLGENRRVKVILFPGGAGTPGGAPKTPVPDATTGPAANLETETNGAGQGS